MFEKKNSETEFLFKKNNVSLYVKREDRLHKYVSGNKFRKLKYNILEAKEQRKEVLLTFGGAYSNHISATAYAGKIHGFKTIGVIRGDELGKDLATTLARNATLKFASDNGMRFYFVSRSRYRNKMDVNFVAELKDVFGDFYLIPEGGTNELAIKGCEEILTKEDSEFDYICCAVGTGGTISGIINSIQPHQKILGFPALKGDFLHEEIEKLINKQADWKLITDYHFGGFAKINEELVRFINSTKAKYGLALDPVYTGKMLFGITDLIAKNYFPKESKVLLIHTGGLQGIKAMNQKLRKKKLIEIV